MGEVYLARRRAAGVEKWLVVKRMRPERAGDARFLDLFMREARLSMSLAHQNIVPVFDFGRIDDQVFLAMERVEGKDLGSSITKAAKGMPPLLAAFIAAECCQALDYAHRRKGPDGADLGIVHRDVTPRNVLLSWSGEVKLTDFGIAALAGDATTSKTAGTPAYMAPEQARGETTDVRADVYAVGMVLREALTGQRPRGGNERENVLAAAQAGTLEPWPAGFDESPLKVIVDRATQSNKEERYADARAMLEELDNFIVAERAARKGEAPARQLAAWLQDVWQGERDDVTVSNVDIDAQHLMSFLDDGMFDVVGTGTQRSMAMTAADEVAPVPTSGVASNVTPSAAGMSSPSASVVVSPQVSSPDAAPAPAEHKARWPWLLLAAAFVALGAGALVLTIRKEEAPPKPMPTPVVTMAADAQALDTEPDNDPIAEAPPADAAPPPIDSARMKLPPRGTDAKPALQDAKPADTEPKLTPPPPAPKFKVMINSTPWSYFTIDNDPTKYTTLANVELTAGPHKIHFLGNEAFPADKAVSIVVPETDGLKVFEKLPKAPTP
jgi:serine/threonine-protein kinase